MNKVVKFVLFGLSTPAERLYTPEVKFLLFNTTFLRLVRPVRLKLGVAVPLY